VTYLEKGRDPSAAAGGEKKERAHWHLVWGGGRGKQKHLPRAGRGSSAGEKTTTRRMRNIGDGEKPARGLWGRRLRATNPRKDLVLSFWVRGGGGRAMLGAIGTSGKNDIAPKRERGYAYYCSQ